MTTPNPRPNEALLQALGLPADATRDQVARTRADLEQVLSDAPESVRGWASAQRALADEALAAFDAPAVDPVRGPDMAGPQNVASASAHADVDDGIDLADVVDDDDLPAPGASSTAPRRGPSRRTWAILATVVLLPLLVLGIYFGGDPGTPHPGATASPAAADPHAGSTPTPVPVDPAQEKQLRDQVAANPSDTDAMHQLAVMYFKANDMEQAAHWDEQILQVKPEDEDAMLELGVTRYNRNDLPGAEELWQRVIAKNERNADAHFDLGFLYLNQEPPQMDKCEEHWQKVIDIDPSSDLAQYVSGYMRNHASGASASPSPAPTARRS